VSSFFHLIFLFFLLVFFLFRVHNFGKYREALLQITAEENSGPCIPFLGLILRDLTFLNDGNPKKFKGDLYNFNKLRRIGETIFSLGPFQAERYTFRTNRFSELLTETLKAPYCIVDDNALYSCSQLCEPRGEEDATPQPIRLFEKWSRDTNPKPSKASSKS